MITRALHLSVIVFVLVTSSLAAQPLQSGAIYTLQGNSGKYLSAHHDPAQSIGLSPNQAGWEQWKYDGNLVSYHGTTLMIAAADGAVFHAPRLDSEERLQIFGVKVITTSAGQQVGVHATAVVGGKVTISMLGSDGRRQVLTDNGVTAVSEPRSCCFNSEHYSRPDQWWTIVAVTSPDNQRQSTAQRVVIAYSANYTFESYHHTFAQFGAGNKMGMTHEKLKPVLGMTLESQKTRNQVPLLYGDAFWLLAAQLSDGRTFYLAPVAETGGQFTLQLAGAVQVQKPAAALLWTLVDPDGRYHAGDRVPAGAKVVLRSVSAGKHLSADPAFRPLLLSPNTAGWERWTLGTVR